MSSKKLYYILIAAVSLAILSLFGVAYGANSLLQSEAKKLAGAKANNDALDNQKVELANNERAVREYSELSKIAAAVVPQDKDQIQAVNEILNIANQSNIPRLSSITFPASSLGATGAGAVRLPSGMTQVTPVKDIPGVYNLEITVALDGSSRVPYATFLDFLSRLERNRRTAQVNSITVEPDTRNPNMVAFTLIINEYLKP